MIEGTFLIFVFVLNYDVLFNILLKNILKKEQM